MERWVLAEAWIYLLTGLITALAVVAAGLPGLRWLQQHGCRQYIREDGPDRHFSKAGTPTMGGLLFVPLGVIAGAVIPLLLGAGSVKLGLLAGLTLGFLLLGLTDDGLMLRHKGSLGLKARQKLALQFIFAGLFLFIIYQLQLVRPLLRLPFSLGFWELPGWLYYLFAWLLIVFSSNATNLTDGLDGLLAGLGVICAAAFALVIYWLGYHPELGIFSCALAGAGLGFLFFNRHPARVFMGDTGSLALGAAFAGLAILSGLELLLFFFGAIFFLEALSVIMQVVSFKSTGRRVFKMSPLHHHFELSGWQETRVVKVFWGSAALISLITLCAVHWGWKIPW
jgi:phospho-N-acetylmuramoyl-pentapeptide-transferase